jgi:hypothetical protein
MKINLFLHWNVVFIESYMYKSVLGKINKLQKKTIYFQNPPGLAKIIKWFSPYLFFQIEVGPTLCLSSELKPHM